LTRDHNKIGIIIIIIIVVVVVGAFVAAAFHNIHDAIKRFPQTPGA
jgi:flagellar basal body-associated protein FliL